MKIMPICFSETCLHGKKWAEPCHLCRIVSLQESLRWMKPQVERDEAELASLLKQSPTP